MKYNFYEKAVISVITDLKKQFKNFAYVSNQERFQEFPVFLQTSGDQTYMTVHSDRLEKKDKSDKVTMPFMALAFSGISINEANKTNEISDGEFVIDINGFNTNYSSEMSTYDTTVRIEANVMFSDIFQYLAFVEYLMNGVYKNRPFRFSYFGKVQQGTWALETTDHDVEMDLVGAFSTEQVSSHQESLSFQISLPYPSFNLNDSLTASVDGDGDGKEEGGVGVPNNAMASDNVIKSVIHYVDDYDENRTMTKSVVGDDFPKDLQKDTPNC